MSISSPLGEMAPPNSPFRASAAAPAVGFMYARCAVRTREGPVARAGNPVARSLGVRNAENVLKFEIPRRARTSPRLKHATQKPTLLRQKVSALIGSDIEAA